MASPQRTGSAERLGRTLDMVGATTSLVCAIHCAVVALVLGLLPAMSFLAAPWIDWGFLGASVLIGALALVPGYRRHHERLPLLLFTVGVSILLVVRLVHPRASLGELLVVCVAAIALVSAHWQNRGALHRCACGPAHHA